MKQDDSSSSHAIKSDSAPNEPVTVESALPIAQDSFAADELKVLQHEQQPISEQDIATPESPSHDRQGDNASPSPTPTVIADTSSPSSPSVSSSGSPSPSPSPKETPPSRPFSIFTSRQKWTIVALSSSLAIFSPISSNIYVPAIPVLTQAFHESSQNINLTVTIYLIFQAITPAFFASLSDSAGRRPIFIFTLLIYILGCVGLALTPTSAYWLLMLLRCVQSIGGSPAIAIGNGTISDIATPAERGSFAGLFAGLNMLGPAFGPVIGGILVQTLSWRWIFWVLAMACGAAVIGYVFSVPETLRSIVGDGSIPPPLLNSTPQGMLTIRRDRKMADEENLAEKVTRPERKKYDPLSTFKLLQYPDVVLVLVFGSLLYMAFYAVLATFSTLLTDIYGYNDIQVGLCYLATGVGSMISALTTGRFLDWDYKRTKAALNFQPKSSQDLVGFPIEKIRFRYIPIAFVAVVVSVIGYGWSMKARTSVAVPLIMTFFIGAGTQSSMAVTSVLLVDLFPGAGGSITASFNLFRCLFGAVSVSVIDPMETAMGVGWAFTVISAICIVFGVPSLLAVLKKGPEWRAKRLQKLVRLEEEKKVRLEEKKGVQGK